MHMARLITVQKITPSNRGGGGNICLFPEGRSTSYPASHNAPPRRQEGGGVGNIPPPEYYPVRLFLAGRQLAEQESTSFVCTKPMRLFSCQTGEARMTERRFYITRAAIHASIIRNTQRHGYA